MSRFSYFLCAVLLLVYFLFSTFNYFIIKKALGSIQNHKQTKRYSIKQNWFLLLTHFIQMCLFYVIATFIPVNLNALALVIVTLVFEISLLLKYKYVASCEIENKDAYIKTLINSIEKFSGVKHDFYNILQTYSGFISINDMEKLQKYHERLLNTTISAGTHLDVIKHMYENPTLVALILNKMDVSKEREIQFRAHIECSLENLYIDDFDICRVLSNLLDNAIDSAVISSKKKINLFIEKRANGFILITITNSTKEEVALDTITTNGFSSKEVLVGMGLLQVQEILKSYANCEIQFSNFSQEFYANITLYPLQSN